MHWCMDETLALLSVIPFIGYIFAKMHNWWHAKFGHKCHEGSCQSTHVDHSEDGIAHLHFNVVNNVPLDSFTFTIDRLWDAANYDQDLYDLISKEDLQERLGPIADKLIHKLEFDLDRFLNVNEFRWFINGYGRVRATFHGRTFLHDEFSVNHTWSEIKQ
jgi:hypothetical protein